MARFIIGLIGLVWRVLKRVKNILFQQTGLNDFAGIFKHGNIDKMNKLLTDLEKKTTAEVYVVIVNSLDGKPIEVYPIELFNGCHVSFLL